MTTATHLLQDLALRITEQEATLAKLREDYEARNAKLLDLTRRKEELQQQLHELDSEIQQIGLSGSAAPVAAPAHAIAKPAASPSPASTLSNGEAMALSLPKFLLHLVGQAGRPITAKELAQEVVRCNYPSKSKDLPGMVETRVSELVRRKLLVRTPDKTSLVLPGQSSKVSATAPSSKVAESRSTSAAPSQTASSQSSSTGRAPSLKQMLFDVLAESTEPMKTSELAAAVLKRGYSTSSKDFKNVIWVCIGDMENVENIRGQGYRLKRKVAKK